MKQVIYWPNFVTMRRRSCLYSSLHMIFIILADKGWEDRKEQRRPPWWWWRWW